MSPHEVCRVEEAKGATLVHLKDCVEYTTYSSLGKMFTRDKKSVIAKVNELSESYTIRTLVWGKTVLVHLGDFRFALFDSSKTNR